MQPYLLLCLSILFASANNLLLHKFGNRGLDSPGGVLLFNAAVSGIWVDSAWRDVDDFRRTEI